MLVHCVDQIHLLHDIDVGIGERRMFGQCLEQLERFIDAVFYARLGCRKRHIGLVLHIVHRNNGTGQTHGHDGSERKQNAAYGHPPERESRTPS